MSAFFSLDNPQLLNICAFTMSPAVHAQLQKQLRHAIANGPSQLEDPPLLGSIRIHVDPALPSNMVLVHHVDGTVTPLVWEESCNSPT